MLQKHECDLGVMCGFYGQPLDGKWADSVTAYHITPTKNVQPILETGLVAKECKPTLFGDYRPRAVYLFAARADAYDRQVREFLFDDIDSLSVLKITIPSNAFINMRYDGLFNMACICSDGSYPTAIRYTDNIPAGWISKC